MTHAELTAAGFEVDAPTYARLARFVDALLKENRKLNLTSLRDAADVWAVHVCDSLALLPLLPPERPQRLLDLGSGGGVPGIPLAIADDVLRVTLLDATRKKVAALERIVESLALRNVATAWARAEVVAHDGAHREVYDIVTARAVAPLSVLVEYAAGFVRIGGRCWFYKSCDATADEAKAAEKAAQQCALVPAATRTYALPGKHGERALVCYAKTGSLRADLPRLPGRATKKPL